MYDIKATDDDLHEFNDSSKSLFVLQLRCSEENFLIHDMLSVDFRANSGLSSANLHLVEAPDLTELPLL